MTGKGYQVGDIVHIQASRLVLEPQQDVHLRENLGHGLEQDCIPHLLVITSLESDYGDNLSHNFRNLLSCRQVHMQALFRLYSFKFPLE